MSINANISAAFKALWPQNRVVDVMNRRHRLLARIAKPDDLEGADSSFYSPVVHYANPLGRSATFSTAQANVGRSKLAKFTLTRYADYQIIRLTDEEIMASRSDAGAVVRIKQHELDAAFMNMIRSAAHSLYGTGTGMLGRLATSSSGVGTPTVTLASADYVKNFSVGMKVVASSANGGAALRSGGNVATITGIDRVAGTLTITGNWTASIAAIADGDYLFAQGDIDVNGAGQKFPGLLSWIPAASPSASFKGITRSEDPEGFGGWRLTSGGTATGDSWEEDIMNLGERIADAGGMPDLLVCNARDYADILNGLQSKIVYSGDNPEGVARLGFRGAKVAISAGIVEVLPDFDCPKGYAWFLQTEHMKLHTLGALPHLVETGGAADQRLASEDGVEYRVRYWADLGIEAPLYFGIIVR